MKISLKAEMGVPILEWPWSSMWVTAREKEREGRGGGGGGREKETNERERLRVDTYQADLA